MKRKTTIILLIVTVLVIGKAYAQFEISKYTINRGGGKSTGSTYQLTGSIGQVDASNKSTGDNYSITGGFWHAEIVDLGEDIFKNSFEN